MTEAVTGTEEVEPVAEEVSERGELLPEEGYFLTGFIMSRGFMMSVRSYAHVDDGEKRVVVLALHQEKEDSLEYAEIVLQLPDHHKGQPDYMRRSWIGLSLAQTLYQRILPVRPSPMPEFAMFELRKKLEAAITSSSKRKHLQVSREVMANLQLYTRPGPMASKTAPQSMPTNPRPQQPVPDSIQT
jgi:hypothetical protein